MAKTIIGIAVMLALLLGCVGFVLLVIQKVRSGHGLDYYLTGYGVQMNYLGVLITIATVPVAMGVGWLIGIYSKRKERNLLKRLTATKAERKRR